MAKKGQRKKAACVHYDYEAAYQEQLENLDEEGIKKLLEGGKVKSVYATKEVRAGEQLEVEVYPEFTKAQAQDIPPEGMKKKSRQACHSSNYLEPFSSVYLDVLSGSDSVLVRLNGGYSA